jgi:hypothetical protein
VVQLLSLDLFPPPFWQPLIFMLLKFTTTDILNCTLIDQDTGDVAFTIKTTALPKPESEVFVEDERRTEIIDKCGEIVSNVLWTGLNQRQPHITFLNGEKFTKRGLGELIGRPAVE